MGRAGVTAAARATIQTRMPADRTGRTPAAKQLYILRHAKSSWDDPGLDDHERPLAPRGTRAVGLMAEHVRRTEIEPVLVLCSSARRTRETLAGVEPGGEWVIEPELYGADASTVVERLRRVPADAPSVMVIGHNPAMQVLVLRLAASDDVDGGSELEAVRDKFPTGALATLTIQCAWNELSAGCAQLTSFVRPKDLRSE